MLTFILSPIVHLCYIYAIIFQWFYYCLYHSPHYHYCSSTITRLPFQYVCPEQYLFTSSKFRCARYVELSNLSSFSLCLFLICQNITVIINLLEQLLTTLLLSLNYCQSKVRFQVLCARTWTPWSCCIVLEL